MKKSLLLVLSVFIYALLLGMTYEVKAIEDNDETDVLELIEEYYNDGNYTKKSNIYLNKNVLEDLAINDIKAFHGSVHLERTTYYQKDSSGKDLLFMANLDGTYADLNNNRPIDGINSGYRTITDVDGYTYMDHFVYDGSNAIRTYKTAISSVEDFYITLYDFINEYYFTNWTEENNVFSYEILDSDDTCFKDFLAFTAPCLEEVFFNEETQNYITASNMILTISEEDSYFGQYLSLKMYVNEDGLEEGYITSENGLLSEARIYKNTLVFDEKDVPINTNIKDVLNGKHIEGTKVTLVGQVYGVYEAWNPTYNNMSVYVRDFNKNIIVVFRTTEKVSVNDILEVTGTVALYNNTYQIAQGSTSKVITDSVDVEVRNRFELISIDVTPNGTADFNVPMVGIYGSSIEWSCDVPEALTIEDGKVNLNRGEEDVDVELIATIGDNEEIFAFTILAKPDEGEPVVTTLATFEFGANGNAVHVDGNNIGTTKTYTENGYSLLLNSMTNVFGPANDAKGNSCIKLGSSSKTGSFTFTVPENVTEVIIYVAQYKANTTKIAVNGVNHTIPTASNNGEYTAIKVDTTTTKTINFSTVSSGVRCMINTIVFNGYAG